MHKGLSVLFQTKDEFEHLKMFLGEYLYFIWNPAFRENATAVVIHYDDENLLSIGSIGCANTQAKLGCRVVSFKEYFFC